jgi:HD-GYP domain-containing protein (c-di-GMP phosphodiesterase class II)
MKPVIPAAAISSLSTSLYLRERSMRQAAERLAAATLETLLNAIEANDSITGAHVRRVAAYSLVIADAAGFTAAEKHSVERVALFHDIGKLDEALTDIFHESSKLSPQERRAIKKHPQRGAEVLEPISVFYPDLRAGVMAHHERWDGSGYPKKLKGRRIPLSARVVAIADTFDAVTHRRRYSVGRSYTDGITVIADGRGTQFDPDLTDLFLSPPVQEQVKAILRDAHAPGRKKKRRRLGGDQSAPDLIFRWRERVNEHSSARRARRKSR